MLTDAILARFNDHTATASDLRAILADDAASPRPCPDLQAKLAPVLSLLGRMEEGATMADAMAVLEDCARNGHTDTGRGVCADCGTFL
jgi:hypothetical protein